MDFLPHSGPGEKTPGYFDYAATTPCAPEVLEAMRPWLEDSFGNASSVHSPGRAARAVLEEARHEVASLLDAAPGDITFTSGGTEADNLAVVGGMLGAEACGRHGLVSAVEHHAVLYSAQFLRRLGYAVETVPVGPTGAVAVDQVQAMLRPDTTLVSLMLVNNETGRIQPVQEVVARCHAHGVRVHTDAVQGVGVLPVSVRELGVDMLTLSAHKIYGPQGVGALYVRPGTDLAPLTWGGSQENGRRAGTENVAAVVGLGMAARLQRQQAEARRAHLDRISRALQEGMLKALPSAQRLGGSEVVPSIHSWHFPDTDGEALLCRLDLEGLFASMGAACSSGALSASHVLLAMGLSKRDALGVLRFSIGQGTTLEDVERLVEVLRRVVPVCRKR